MGLILNMDTDEIITFDAVLDEEWSDESLIAEHILENGGSASDHQRDLPTTLKIKVVVSDTPITEHDESANRPTTALNGLTGESQANFIDFPKLSWELIRLWKTKRTSVKYICSRRSLDNLLIGNVTVNRTSENTGSTVFDISMKQVIFAQTETTTIKRVGKIPVKADPVPDTPKNTIIGSLFGGAI